MYYVTVAKELINIINASDRVELLRLMKHKERDSLLLLKPHTPTILNLANLDKYIDYPNTIPVIYRRSDEILGIIIGVPVEKYDEDETFPDPAIGARNTVYTVVIQISEKEDILATLEKEYTDYLKRHRITMESRHIPMDCLKGKFDVLKVFDDWRIDESVVCYCKKNLCND